MEVWGRYASISWCHMIGRTRASRNLLSNWYFRKKITLHKPNSFTHLIEASNIQGGIWFPISHTCVGLITCITSSSNKNRCFIHSFLCSQRLSDKHNIFITLYPSPFISALSMHYINLQWCIYTRWGVTTPLPPYLDHIYCGRHDTGASLCPLIQSLMIQWWWLEGTL